MLIAESSHADNRKNNFLVLGEGSTFGINRRFRSPEKKLSINFSKTNAIFCLSCVIMLIIVICLLMENKYLNLKPTIKMSTFELNFVWEVFLMDLVLLSPEKYL